MGSTRPLTTASVEDQEFSFRLAQKGYRMVFAPKACVTHIHDEKCRRLPTPQVLHRFLESALNPMASGADGTR